MLKPLTWVKCQSCGRHMYLRDDGCVNCGFSVPSDVPGSVTGNGKYMQINGGVKDAVDACIDTFEAGFFCKNNGYSMIEIDSILRLELGESFTMRTHIPAAEAFEVISWVKISMES